jgi:L-iditol 2-dehydrogenase
MRKRLQKRHSNYSITSRLESRSNLEIPMRVATYYSNNDVRLENIPKPKIGPHELLVRVLASGICGSDVLEWYRIKRAPLVLGHEISGEIAELGDNVQGFAVGDRVFVSHHVPCNKCQYCMSGHHTACETLHTTNYDPGGFSEYVRVPRINVERGTYRLPGELSYEDATFIEPLGCAIRGQRLAGIEPQHMILVLGCGVAGLLHIQLAKARNARHIIATDVNEHRLETAKKLGADVVINANDYLPSTLREANEGRLADRIVVCTGAVSATTQAFRSVDRGGTILLFAVPSPEKQVSVPMTDFWRNEITMMTSYGAAPNDLVESLKLVSSNKINVHQMITHRLGLAEAGLGFHLVANAAESLKVIIEPQR